MLYEKNKRKQLKNELFKNPTSEYRGTPFWAWNDNLDEKELRWQIGELQKMGFGGAHMHVRSGMATEYLSDEFMDLINACVDESKKRKMLAWLYDEDRWASGAAGGFVTKNYDYRRKKIIFTTNTIKEKLENSRLKTEYPDLKLTNPDGGKETGYVGVKLLYAFDVSLNDDGTLASYRRIFDGDEPIGTRWNVYLTLENNSGWFNNQAYIDTMMPEAVDEFIRITYGRYAEKVGDDFGGVIPSIFTDEPQTAKKTTLPFGESKMDVDMPWTYGIEREFAIRYGFDLVEKLPELVWDLPSGQPSKARYYYHELVSALFSEGFCDRCGKWCFEHGFYLTGHVLHEDSLHRQTDALGEVMRSYRNFGIPGIDMLCNAIELSTAKQAQSAVHQYGREGMLSELYGVTSWGFDFRGHKFQGDWQAALGVTVRVPHLSWYSMKGSAKRDYPASISYQSAWYKEYPYIEDHFARLNTALTRGKPCVNVAVIHPIESYWLEFGAARNTANKRRQIESDFHSLIEKLLFGSVDFDFISEGLLPELHGGVKNKRLVVGKMSYGAVIVPAIRTIRKTTVDALYSFIKKGGRVIFLGDCPECVDGERSDYAASLFRLGEKVTGINEELLRSLTPFRDVEILFANGARTDNFVYNKRIDGKTEWLFIANAKNPMGKVGSEYACVNEKVIIVVKGEKKVSVYDTLSGEIRPAELRYNGGNTEIYWTASLFDSLLLRLDEGTNEELLPKEVLAKPVLREIYSRKVDYTLTEDNVMVLDMAEWSEDGAMYNPREEMLRIDKCVRDKYGYPKADGHDVQPWVIAEAKPEKSVYLRFTFDSKIKARARLAFEEAEEVTLNGITVPVKANGYFADKRIYTMALPTLNKGKNELIIKAPIGKRISLENYFLLGKFGVSVVGSEAEITALPKQLAFGSVVNQGLPFYGAGIKYELPLRLEKEGRAVLSAQKYVGALVCVKVDGKRVGRIVFPPYKLDLGVLACGEHNVEIELITTRTNTFAPLHCCTDVRWQGPDVWYTRDEKWSYEYNFTNNGVLKAPEIEIFEP